MRKKTISKEVTEKESKKAKQAKDALDEKKTAKKSLGKIVWKFLIDSDRMQAIAALGTLLFVWLAYTSYSYQSRYDSFAEYSAALQASSGPSWVLAKMSGKKLAKIETPTSGSGIVPTNTVDIQVYKQIINEQLVLLDEKFGKLDGLMYLNEIPERASIESCYKEIRTDLANTYTSFPAIISAGKTNEQQDKEMETGFWKINTKIDSHLKRIASVINGGIMKDLRNIKIQASIVDWKASGLEVDWIKQIKADREKSACYE